VFNVPTTAAVTVTLDTPLTLGTLQFGNSGSANVGYTVSGSNTLTFNNSGNGATITVTDGSHAINAPVILADNLTVVRGGTNPWTLSFGTASSITDNGAGYSLTMSGSGGTLILSGSDSYTGCTVVEAGTLEVTTAAALPSGTSLTVGAGGTFVFDPTMTAAAVVGAASSAAAVPEPSTTTLLAAAALGLAGCVWKRYRQKTMRDER
jgi:autotransporter-associated beta strand protein